MNTIKLSKRLSKIADYVPDGKSFADVGSDHALLPSYLALEKKIPFAIAVEVNEGPFQAAKKQISNFKLERMIDVRKGDGLTVINQEEVDVIIIAGMGGALIVDILDKGKKKLATVERLILQPNVGENVVRKWLDQNMWDIKDEQILEENGKIYEIIVAEHRKGNIDPTYSSIPDRSKSELYRLGPVLWKEKSSILLKKWKIELKKVEYILQQLEKSQDEKEMRVKKQKMLQEKKWIMGVVRCLEKGKI
ncbi:hypothetical protein BHF71_07540 [Vulcanibacillus modesticaldus]|uniref:SAM-dependent methyltransferase n=1 Tax=Vulcanibacillus modesticaldus TaxID=337097 RepID=A0A1D2YVI4_9BACI|nr:tRNA (adenine(22)-N(1))-methyltransferase TrmK [Vulcanibacillus modesticaldus]OEF99738.1 hypothetical protein BHF71_07540 [Vulcanibacillus modesticaldus]